METESIKKITINKALTCSLDESVMDIAKKLRTGKERRIFVVDKNGKMEGIITTTDLVYKALCDGDKCSKMNAKELMVKAVKSVDLNDDFEKALEIMNELKTFNCPVTDNGKLVGVISYHELVDYLFNSVKK
ncbi:MAG: CBS domain-containing protein [Nanoarchaeota archaeon]